MGIIRMGVPEELVLFMQRAFCLNVFIETGTFKGATSCWAADHFKKVITIELSKELFEETAEKYRHLQNVDFRYGNSSDELANIVKHLDESAVFWLDAHHCSLNTAGNGSRAPILEEIDAISLSAYDHFILIDDARLFLAPPPDPHRMDEYPDICTLIEQVKRHKKHYIVIYDDVIICVPEAARETISFFCKDQITQIDKLFWAEKANTRQPGFFAQFMSQLKGALSKGNHAFAKKCSDQKRWNDFLQQFDAFAALNKKNNRFPCRFEDHYPCLDDDKANTPFDRHYVLHPAWAMRILVLNKPDLHIDIGSTLRFVTQLSCIMPVRHYDYRPPLLNLDNLECAQVDLTNLPFQTNSIGSLSCMHTLEHIGLGRYGDRLDSDGDIKAAGELARVLLPGGNLLFVVPVGRSRIEFNAHRIYAYCQVLELFPSLQVKQYALIPDSHETGDILYGASEELTDSQNHGCGCFWFTKVYDK
jgi:uncharacterized protein DUF268